MTPITHDMVREVRAFMGDVRTMLGRRIMSGLRKDPTTGEIDQRELEAIRAEVYAIAARTITDPAAVHGVAVYALEALTIDGVQVGA